MVNSVSSNTNSNPKSKTAGTPASKEAPPSIFSSTETAGSIASSATNTTSGSLSLTA